MNIAYIVGIVAALLLTQFFIIVLRKVAFRFNLVDKPNYRKVHNQPIPLIGGISIFISTTLVLMLILPIDNNIGFIKTFLVCALILVMIGVVDDRFDLSASLKLAIQIILAHVMYEYEIRIDSFYGLFGIYELPYLVQYLFTIGVIAGVVNAFNLMDGVDGLAAAIAILGFIGVLILALLTQQWLITMISLTFLGSLLAFLRFNLSKKYKIFMGDAGSTLIGFVLVVIGIKLIQSADQTKYLYSVIIGVVSILLVPVLDALRVFRRRAKSGKSPFHADKTHLHHLILNQGLQHVKITLVIIIISLIVALVGYVVFLIFGLSSSIFSMVLMYYCIAKAIQFSNKLIYWKNRILILENRF